MPYPTAPQPPGGQPGHRGGGRSSRSTTFVVLAVVLVLAVGVGGWFLFSPDNEDSSGQAGSAVDPNTPGGRMWLVNEDMEDGDKPNGFWHVGDTVVKANASTLVAYRIANGEVAWTLELGGQDDAFCAPTNASDEGLLVVGHGDSNCGQNITMIDLKTGEKGWSRPLEPEENPLSFHIAISGSSYAIHTIGGWNLHSIENGDVISSAYAEYDSLDQSINQDPFSEDKGIVDGDEICAVDAVAGGPALIRQRSCATVVSVDSDQLTDFVSYIEKVDPANGETLWSLPIPENRWFHKIHSVSPLVISLSLEEHGGPAELLFVDDQGEMTGVVPIEDTAVRAEDKHSLGEELCRSYAIPYHPADDCGGVAVAGERMYISPTGLGGKNPITAMNARTGAVEWTYTTEDFFEMTVLAADEKGVIVYQAGFDGPGQVVRISKNGKQAEPLFQTDASMFLQSNYHMAWHEGALVFSPTDYGLEYDVVAYGPKGKMPKASASPSDGAG